MPASRSVTPERALALGCFAAAVLVATVAASVPLALALAGLALTTGLTITLVLLAAYGARAVATAALLCGAATLAMNGVRVSASVSVSDICFVAAAGLLLPSAFVTGLPR